MIFRLHIVDDYSRFTWVFFLAHKHETFSEFVKFCKKIQKQTSYAIMKICSDHGRKFENEHFTQFCDEHSFEHAYSFPRAPAQNGIAELKNQILQERSY